MFKQINVGLFVVISEYLKAAYVVYCPIRSRCRPSLTFVQSIYQFVFKKSFYCILDFLSSCSQGSVYGLLQCYFS